MTDLLAARIQMAVSLGFHIIFAAIGMAMPFLMAISHACWLKTKDPDYLKLTKAWSKGVAILFATGAVSGTVLAFELGLLWPGFMEHAGPIIGMPLSWEGTAFFLEAIALGVFLYGWGKIPPWIHWASGLVVGISGVMSALFVICANGWMNSPSGFDYVNGEFKNIDPWAAMFNAAAWTQGWHMVIAAFTATGFAAAGVHAWGLLRNVQSNFHRKAFGIALLVGSVAALLQPVQGDSLAKQVVKLQPLKFAAMESLYETSNPAPFNLLGIKIPGLLSFLAHGDLHQEVKGLEAFPRENWPPVDVTHISFQVMILIGMFLSGVSLLGIFGIVKRKTWVTSRRFLKLLVFCAPLGFIAVEAGWVVTEVGRQPWIIYEVLKTKDAVTPMPGLLYPMVLFTLVYLFLAFVVAWLMRRQFQNVE